MPDWLRTEVYHSLSVHFPVALLIMATFCKLAGRVIRNSSILDTSGSLLLVTGALTAWIAVYTGDLADGIVSRELCDPTVLKDHENAAYWLSYIFTGVALLDLALQSGRIRKFKEAIRWLIVVICVAGSGLLVYAGDLGASLVYEQAAGVNVPPEDCEEFE